MSGFEVCRQLKENPTTQAIPIIFLSGLAELDDRLEGFRLGAVDFITKPFQKVELLARVRTHLELGRLRNTLSTEVAKQTGALQAAYQELTKSSRMKDEFLSTMSHELRTPLTAVLGMTEIVRDGAYGSLNAEQAEALEIIERSSRHLLRLINDILDFSQMEAGQVELRQEDCVAAEIIKSALSNVRDKAVQKNISLSSRIELQNSMVWADPQQLKKILVCLLDNAVKFTPGGGSAGVIIRRTAGRSVVEFEVWDTGAGIADADLPRLFKPFSQIDSGLDRKHEGSGLGLALAQKLAQLQGGKIRVLSSRNEGSRFIVSLPQPGEADE